jgi:hypothetical protein
MQQQMVRAISAYVGLDRIGRPYVMVLSQWASTDGKRRGATSGKVFSAPSLEEAGEQARNLTSHVYYDS